MARTKQTKRDTTTNKPAKRVRKVFAHPFQKSKDVGTRTFNGFSVLKKIATGAFGRVYKAKKNPEDDQLCALKFVDLRDDDTKAGVSLEFELANLFSEEGAGPKVFGYWRLPKMDLAIMATELWTTTLEDYLQENDIKKPSKAIMDIIHKRVKTIHESGHVHLDIHSGNVLLKLDEKKKVVDVVLTDFGKSTHAKGVPDWFLADPIKYYKLKPSNDPKNLDWQMVERIKKGKL